MSQGKLTAALLFAVVPTVLAACVEAPEEGDDLDLSTETQELLGCPHWGCNSNSPVIDIWDFHELNDSGLPNAAGVVLHGLWKGGIEYQPRVTGARLRGYPKSAAVPVLEGLALDGAYFDVETPDATHWQIQIHNVSNVVGYWIGSAGPYNETYELLYTKPGWGLRPLCKNPPGRVDGEGRIWGRQYEALIYTGDRYNAETFEVTATDYRTTTGWFNLACAGSALAKLHLTRHTTAGMDSTHPSNWQSRQAMLKMYAADVCGNGFSSTMQGEPLRWTNTLGWQPLPSSISSYEAIWSEDGAVCLDTHRLKDDPLWVTLNIENQIKANCPNNQLPPPCNIPPGGAIPWAPGSYVVTANP
ncbi:MAG: hypothetical protein K8M05_06780 [Deltaproteobacteria bacterium]|nr:hypothetical protein [Kofleriaceae bacterium]